MACKSILVVLCGLPCSGKSYLASLLKERCVVDLRSPHCDSAHGLCSTKSVVICYDHLMPAELEGQLIQSSESQWKSYRQCIRVAVGELVAMTRGISPRCWCPGSDGGDSDLVERLKCKVIEMNGVTDLNSSESRFVFIIDDNMYLKSMRYEYFQVARKYNIGFCEICIKCPQDILLQRNDERALKVQEHVIRSMAIKFEEPLRDKQSWENMSLIVENKTDFQSCWSEICSLLQSTFEKPVPTLEDDIDVKAIAREVCLTSFIHHADNVLRRLLSEIMETHKRNNMSKHKMRSMALCLNTTRHAVLDDIKSKTIAVPEELIEEVASANMDSNSVKLKTFLHEEMNKKLQEIT